MASLEHRVALKWAGKTNRVLQVGSLAAVTVIGARLFSGAPRVGIWEFESIPLKGAWMFFLFGTFAHAFCTLFFVAAIREVRRKTTYADQEALRSDIVADGGAYIAVAKRRLPRAGQRLIRMSAADPSSWIARLGALALLLAVLQWWWKTACAGRVPARV